MVTKYEQEQIQLITVQIQTVLANINQVCETLDDSVVLGELQEIYSIIADCIIPAGLILDYVVKGKS